jgi:hypothetical protein
MSDVAWRNHCTKIRGLLATNRPRPEVERVIESVHNAGRALPMDISAAMRSHRDGEDDTPFCNCGTCNDGDVTCVRDD